MNRDHLLLAIIVVVGAFFRFFALGFNSFWIDELATLKFASHSFLGIWNLMVSGEYNPPLYYWIIHAIIPLGTSEWWIRFPSAIFGICSIPVFYGIGTELYRDTKVGVASAALAAFSPYHLFYSQEARAYTLALLLFGLSLYFYLKGLKNGSWKTFALSGLFAAGATWAHFYVIPFVVMMGVAVLLFHRERIKPMLIGAIVYLWGSLLVLLPVAWLFNHRVVNQVPFGFHGVEVITATITDMSGYSEATALLFAILFTVGIIYLIKKKTDATAITLLALIIPPLIVSVLLADVITMMPRYLIYLLPLYYVPIAGSWLFFRDPKVLPIVTDRMFPVFLALLLALNIPMLYIYETSYQKPDNRGIISIVENSTVPGDAVIVVPAYHVEYEFWYYYNNATDGTIVYGVDQGIDLVRIARQYPHTTCVLTVDYTGKHPEGDARDVLQKYAPELATVQNTVIYRIINNATLPTW